MNGSIYYLWLWHAECSVAYTPAVPFLPAQPIRLIVNGAATQLVSGPSDYQVNGRIPITGCVIDRGAPLKKPQVSLAVAIHD